MADVAKIPIIISPNKIQLESSIGDKIQVEAKSLSMPRFQDECRLYCEFEIAGDLTPSLQGENIVTDNGDIKVVRKATPVMKGFNEFGGIDEIITLYRKPSTNLLTWGYDATKLIPYLQPPLTPQDIEDGCVRPEYVINSIAWYHNTKGGIVTTADKSKGITTGKAFHQYRMMATDSKGNKSWTNWELLNGSQYRLRIDDKFWQTAVYPVTLAPVGDTFGYTDIGGSTTSTYSDFMYGSSFEAPANGTANSISAYTKSGTNDDGPIAFAIYDDDDGDTFLQSTSEISSPNPDDWNTSDLSAAQPPITSGVDYWLVHWGEETSLPYDSATGRYGYKLLSYPASWPNPWGVSGTGTSNYSIYCTYTAGGGVTNIDVTVPLADTINVADFAPSMVLDIKQDIPLAVVDVAGIVPSVTIGQNASIIIPLADSIGLSGIAPEIDTVKSPSITVPLAEIDAAGVAPSTTTTKNPVIVIPLADTIDIAGVAPEIVTTKNPVIIIPLADTVDISSIIPEVSTTKNSVIVIPLADNIAISGLSPEIGALIPEWVPLTLLSRSTSLSLQARTVALTLQGRSPSLTLNSRSQSLTLQSRSWSLTLQER